jgi:hypothetical protein
MKVLTAADGEILSRYCILANDFDEAKNADDRLKIDAKLSVRARDLGLTPASRASVQVVKSAAPEPEPESLPMLKIAQ